ncbi:2-succinyl-5-enolpyruvyl-6-hydroxy-3-cyclohexene-1-carboxylic-acid synthase [Bacillus chungangensis]|uniref:2-succinyl-5-enolpyruvyl-6-hydroxy-3-cyclohexene-1-carboxylate synthase n=1 Tax=Bacillus chungangensis TaxID=587633 RepID=A0ABT9WUM2_9BACI|nr:2-succinyl-5-enolpyruvyl-6-hydroxy-3-cyclohexene-1-carboxylic-acid synthase [Bacillus chungangensis]MDQ0176930.1 2-succinyl-5-enolpyruvyl-6-hydroxy-3-cyclohexene-1-carboxylate synthase [Bacillus chungangensis]
MNQKHHSTDYLAAFVDEIATEVQNVVISPGSRSTPLAMLIAEHPDLRVYVNVDERSAAFFALGIAKATQAPVVLLCTSGTAAANYFPAVIEAKLSRIPLIVLTSDRPHELRDIGAPQAIDQIHLYGSHVKWFSEMAIPDSNDEMIAYVRRSAVRAIGMSVQAPKGPVHLNFPLREPLIPKLEPSPFPSKGRKAEKPIMQEAGSLQLNADAYQKYARHFSKEKRGVIICGELVDEAFHPAVINAAEKLGYPIIADPLSQLRSNSLSQVNIIDSYDTFLHSDEARKQLSPKIILRFGPMPVSKKLSTWLKGLSDAEQYIIDGGLGWRDPVKVGTNMIACDEAVFCKEISFYAAQQKDRSWLHSWQKINKLTKQVMNDIIAAEEELYEGKATFELMKQLPQKSTLFIGNSMPIRDVDTFFHCNNNEINLLCNRGANGIDGVVSAALGASVYRSHLYLLIGDLSFFHDLNGLLAAKMYHLSITIILMNNNGGGIFSYLPQAQHPKYFETLFGTPTDLDFYHAVKMYGGTHTMIDSWDQFQLAIKTAPLNGGLQVIEVPTDRQKNVEKLRFILEQVSREINNYLSSEENES